MHRKPDTALVIPVRFRTIEQAAIDLLRQAKGCSQAAAIRAAVREAAERAAEEAHK